MLSPMKLEISLFPFFCGNVFTSLYEYADLAVGRHSFDAKNEFAVSLHIKNIGEQEGIEVARLSTPLLSTGRNQAFKLRRFEKISLKPGESKKITFVFASSDVFSPATENKELEITAGTLKRKISIQH